MLPSCHGQNSLISLGIYADFNIKKVTVIMIKKIYNIKIMQVIFNYSNLDWICHLFNFPHNPLERFF